MTYKVLIYGANGHSGRMIAERAITKKLRGVELILAGRSAGGVTDLARKHGLEHRVFGLGDRPQVIRNLVGVNLVVNAAGPFSLTAERLAKASIEVGSSYVDINGEVDVYMKLDDLARQAEAQEVALVSSAGHNAGASCLLLDYALGTLAKGRAVGAIRIGMSMASQFSRGSAVSGVRLVREQVLTIRRGETINQAGQPFPSLVKWHEPVGRLERMFDFGRLERGERQKRGPRRMTSAVNMVDTLLALQTVERGPWKKTVTSIESYLEMDPAMRAAYQVGSTFASLMSVPLIAAEAQMLTNLMTSDRPSAAPGKQAVVLEIDGPHHERLIELRLRVESGYAFTANLIVALIDSFAQGGWSPGWKTPSEILCPGPAETVSAGLLSTFGELDQVRI